MTDILHQIQNGPNTKSGPGSDPSATEADLIRATERERLRALVDADMEVANRLHADDFQLISPGGWALSKEEYLGLIAAGDVDYLVDRDPVRLGVVGQALRQPLLGLVQQPFPQGCLGQIGAVPRQEVLFFQFDTAPQALS